MGPIRTHEINLNAVSIHLLFFALKHASFYLNGLFPLSLYQNFPVFMRFTLWTTSKTKAVCFVVFLYVRYFPIMYDICVILTLSRSYFTVDTNLISLKTGRFKNAGGWYFELKCDSVMIKWFLQHCEMKPCILRPTIP